MTEDRTTETGRSANFLQRQAESLGFKSPSGLAKALDMSPHEVIPLWRGTRGELIEADADPVYGALADYIDKRLGLLMSVREELQRKLNQDRRTRAAQRLRALER